MAHIDAHAWLVSHRWTTNETSLFVFGAHSGAFEERVDGGRRRDALARMVAHSHFD